MLTLLWDLIHLMNWAQGLLDYSQLVSIALAEEGKICPCVLHHKLIIHVWSFIVNLFLNVVCAHHGCHKQEWSPSTPQRGCSFSGLTRTEWTLPGRRSSASPQHGATGPLARSHHDPTGAEPGTTHLGAREWRTEGEKTEVWSKGSKSQRATLWRYLWF